MDSCFISSYSLLSLAEEALYELKIYLPERSGEKVSPGCQRNLCTSYRASAYGRNGAKHAPPFRVCGSDTWCTRSGVSPHAGLPPGQGSHLPSLGDVMYKSLQLGNAGNVPPAIPGCAPLQSRRCPLSPRAYSQHRARVRCQGLRARLLEPPFCARPDNGCEDGRKEKKRGEAAQCWHALKADSFTPDVLNHMWRSVCGQMLLETDC